MKIVNINAREILDSRGFPTIACDVFLEDGSMFSSSVPSGISKGKYEAHELRDGNKRLFGKGVLQAVDNINNEIAPQFLGKEPNAVQMDLDMLQMDGTENKSKLGANTILALSMALYRAHAYVAETELFDFIALVSGCDTVSLPLPMINFINGGLHADNNLLIQEYLVIPYGAQNMKSAIEKSLELFFSLKDILTKNGKTTLCGDEGGFAPNFENDEEPFDYIFKAAQNCKLNADFFSIGIDVATSQYYDINSNTYNFNGEKKSSDELIDYFVQIYKKFNLYSMEDVLSEDDWSGWIKLMNTLETKVHIVADDLFVTNPERIAKGIELKAANTVVIKPNQIGTVTETLQAIQLCKEYGLSTVISNRSGETDDTFIVDLAVGSNASYIKCGGLTRGERICKYNRLLEIENLLTNFVIYE